MAIARLNDHVADPKGGRYGRDPVTHQLNGALYGKAADTVSNVLPPATMASKLIAARGVLHSLNSVGITSIHDIARPTPSRNSRPTTRTSSAATRT